MTTNKANGQYEVLSPWPEVDPIPLKGISPRVTNLAGKKIGLFRNFKQAGKKMLTVVEGTLKERYPNSEFSWFDSIEANVLETETENKARFEEWAKRVDTVVAAVGD